MINAPMGALGVESDLLAVLSSWIEGAFGRLVTLDVIPLDERLSRERCVDTVSNLLTGALSDARIASRLVASDIKALTNSLLTMVGYALDLDPNSGYSPAISQQLVTSASHPASRPTSMHRRRISSNFIPPVTPQVSMKVPLDCIIPVYVGILASQSTMVSYADLDTTVPILCRALAYYSAPIPMPSTSVDSQTHSSSPYYDQLISALSGLLNGHYAANVRLIIRKALMPSILNKKDAAQAIQTSTGAYRIIRVLIRHSLRERLTTQASSDKYGEVIDDTDYDPISQAFEVSQFGRVSQEALKAWIVADCHGLSCEAVLEEAVHIINDVLNVYDSSDVHGMDMDEAIALGETLAEVVKYVKAFRCGSWLCPLIFFSPCCRPPGNAPFTIPLTNPKAAPTPFLRNLTSLLSRETEITPIKPPLTEVLLSIAENLADVDTAKIPEVMYKQRNLTPTNSDWIENWRLLLTTPALHSSARPLTRSAIFHHMESLYAILSDLPEYRIPLGSLVYNYIEAQAGGREAFVDATPWRILGEEIVLRSSEIDHGPITYDDEGEVVVDHIHPDVDTIIEFLAGLSSSSHHRGSLRTPVVASPTSFTTHDPLTTPLWRHSDIPRPQPSLDLVAHSVIQSGVPTPQVTSPPSQSEVFTTQGSLSFSAQSLAVSATAALITTFMELVYTSRSLGEHNLVVAVRIFRILLDISLNAPEAHARLCALQFLLRMRADREHRLHYAGHVVDAYTRSMAAQIGRGDIPPINAPLPTGGEEERSSRAMSDAEPSREGLKYRGRGMKPSRVEPPSRSRSRAPPLPSQAPSQSSQPAIWRLSDESYFKISVTQTFSERLTSYDPDGPGRKVVLPLSDWLMAVIKILGEERDWEILSYVLCHLPSQLANKHLMCGPKCRIEIVHLFDTFCTTLIEQNFASSVVWPSHAHPRDAAGLAYNAMIIMTSYRVCLDPNRQHLLVETFYQGLSGPPAAQQCCLHGLTLCAYEMPASIPRKLVDILDRLSQIMSSPQMPVNIMNFLHVVGSKPELYTNFTQDHYKKVFAVCVRYLSDFNRHSVTPGQSWAIAQHVRIMSFATLYVWFLAVDLPDRPAHVSDITRGLLAANEGNDKVDEPTEVCFDWLARYTYGSADPRPAGSPLDDIIMRKGLKRTTVNASELARPTKAWLMGDTAVITMKALPKAGWVEIVARRACGLTKILCRLDNVPMIGPGDVEPDMLSLPGILMMDRPEHDMPPDVQGDVASGAAEEVRRFIAASSVRLIHMA
jgi:tuberous sclerosis protein 2